MRSQAEQLKIAETLLAEIQHGRRAVPESLRRLIRDYFSDHERGLAINEQAELETSGVTTFSGPCQHCLTGRRDGLPCHSATCLCKCHRRAVCLK